MKLITKKLKPGRLHEKHAVATCSLGNHLSIRLQTEGNQEKPVRRWPVAGPSGYEGIILRGVLGKSVSE